MSWKNIIAIIAAVVLGVPLLAILGILALVSLIVLNAWRNPDFAGFYMDPTPRWTPDGASIVFGHGDGKIYVASADGTRLHSISEGSRKYDIDISPSISPDGSRVAYATLRYETGSLWNRTRNFEIVTSALDALDKRRITRNRVPDVSPIWSPQGNHISFLSRNEDEGTYSIYITSVDRSTVQKVISSSDIAAAITHFPSEWSPNAQYLSFVALDSSDTFISYIVGLNGSAPIRLGETISGPTWLPDGQRIAFTKIEDKFASLYTADSAGSNLIEVPSYARVNSSISPSGSGYGVGVSWHPRGSKMLMRQYVVEWDETGFRVIHLPGLDDVEFFATSWSPDGSRIAINAQPSVVGVVRSNDYIDGPAGFDATPRYGPGVVLYTLDQDGSDPQVLVVQDGNGNLLPANGRPLDDGQSATTIYFDGAGPPPAPFDIEQCANGVVFPNPDVNHRVVEDCETLLRIRDSLGANPPLNWNTDTIIFNWEGIVLGNAGVGSLRLPDRDLTGVISSEFAKLSGLTELDLSGNWLGGKIPSELGTLTNLEKLDLSRNGLSGNVPAALGHLLSIKLLDVSYNNLSGKIPSELGNLTNLETNLQELDLSYNNLSGSLSPDLFPSYGNFLLELSGNSLEGCVPRSSLLYGPKRYPYYDSPLEYCEE